MKNTMRAAITDGKGNLWIADDVPVPEFNEYQCLCRIEVCATCSGTDKKHIEDKLPWTQDYPGILGHEPVGYVIKKGKKVRYIKKGEHFLRPTAVYPGERLGKYSSLWGGFAEYGLITDAKAFREDYPNGELNSYTAFQLPVPDTLGLSPEDASMLITLKEVAGYVDSAGIGLGHSVLITGTGPVGLAMLRFAKIFGADPVISAGRRHAPLKDAEDLGADFTINTSSENICEKAMEYTDEKGVDFVIDTTGSVDIIKQCKKILSGSGKIAAYATYERGTDISEIIGADKICNARTGEDIAHEFMLDAVKLSLVDPARFYSHVLPLEDICKAFEMLKNKTATKIVIKM